jgi:uncharacterized protein (TIGR02265 family)
LGSCVTLGDRERRVVPVAGPSGLSVVVCACIEHQRQRAWSREMRKNPPSGFHRPDYSLPFTLSERLRGLSAEKTVKGFLLQGLANAAKEAGNPLPAERKFIAFKDYPLTEGAQLLVDVARRIYPDVPEQEGLRRMGHRVFGFLSDSVLGRVLLGTVGMRLETLLDAMPKIFGQLIKNGRVTVLERTANSAHLLYQDFCPDLLDCLHLGILEGGLKAYHKEHDIFLRQVDFGVVEFWGFWE